jgi:hypothetical protein
MDNAAKYRKDFDLVFQELEEKEQLQRQAESQPRDEFKQLLLKQKSIQELLKSVPLEDRKKILDSFLAAKFPSP